MSTTRLKRLSFTLLSGVVLASLALLLVIAHGAGAQSHEQDANAPGNAKKPGFSDSGAMAVPEEPQERRVDEDPQGNPYVAGELNVIYKPEVTPVTKDAVAQKFEAKSLDKFPEIDARHLSFPEIKAEPSEEARERALERKKQALEEDPRVETADYNYLRQAQAPPNDPGFTQGLQWGLSRINAPQAWDRATGAGTRIAVLDTGIDTTHPDLASKVDYQIDFVDGTNPASDADGHGTHVAGIAAAVTNNGTGVAGAAPNARLQIARVLGPNGGSDADIVAAIDWALLAPAADVINMSLGKCAPAPVLESAINRAWNGGVVVVASAGNEGDRTNCINYPASYPNAISVAATNTQNTRSNFSTFNNFVDIAAPGGQDANQGTRGCLNNDDILATLPPGAYGFSGGYGYLCGTSMAAPYVSGVAALLASQGLSATQIRQRIESTATDLGPAGRDNYYGYGLTDANRAVTNTTPPPPPPPPPPSNTAPKVLSYSPKGAIRDTTPTIRANVVDKEHYLYKRNLKLWVDGKRKTNFRVQVGETTKLTYNSSRLRKGRHVVKVRVTDPQGRSATRIWRFTIRSR